ncbi:MAG: DEAD/DEAH box helicase [Rubrimonas sp.]
MTTLDGVPPGFAEALAARGYETLTPVQQAVLDPDLAGRDALVSAQTGSGKTVAFGLAIANTLLGGAERFGPAARPLGLAVAPTRELALQVQRELEWLYAPTGAVIAQCVGGMDPRAERRALERGAHIVVGTPGRLRDHITRGALDVGALRAVVLDEADEMLDLGFREDLEFILDAAPDTRRTLMFSATVPKAIAALAQRYQRDAVRVTTAAEASQHRDIEYLAVTCAAHERENAIYNLLRYYDARSAIVFCGTRAAVAHMTARFANRGFAVVGLSGELSQSERSHALQAMRDGRARVCVATDVAARGIDLPGLELVIHADLPVNAEALLHRSGRTGRAGAKGVSALIVPHRARRKAEGLLGAARVQAIWTSPPTAAEIIERDDERIMEDPGLSDPPTEDEAPLIAALLAAHGPERIAAAFIRRLRANMAAPEDISDEPDPKATREAFGPSQWFALTVGRSDNADPRWLLPMLCGSGGLTRRDVGAIRIMDDHTFVQIAEGAVERLLAALGPGGELERNVVVAPSDGPSPDGGRHGTGPRGPRGPDLRNPRGQGARGHRNDGPKRPRRPRED